MVYRILSIISGILFSLLVVMGGICLAYSVSVPAVTSAVDAAKAAINDAASDTMDSLGEGATSVWEQIAGAVGDGVSSMGEKIASVFGVSSSTSALGNLSSLTSSSDSSLPEAYRTWKSLVGDPVGTVLSGSGVSRAVLEGVAGGSSSAGDVLAGLDEAALTTIAANASSYSATVGSATVSASLPSEVRSAMWEANAAAQQFASSVQNLVASARSVKNGDVTASLSLVSNANSVVSALQTMDSCIATAEAGLV